MSDWTFKTLKKYFDAAIAALEKRLVELIDERWSQTVQRFEAAKEAGKLALDAAKEAMQKAENSQEKRNESLNELRGMAGDWRSEFARQETVTTLVDGLREKIEGQQRQIAALEKGSGETEGRGLGLNKAFGYILAVAALAIAYFKHG